MKIIKKDNEYVATQILKDGTVIQIADKSRLQAILWCLWGIKKHLKK